MSKHTGPWTYHDDDAWVYDAEGRSVARTPWVEDYDDRRLIAAAPNLLEFAKYARGLFAVIYGDDTEAVRLAENAIAKAEGRHE